MPKSLPATGVIVVAAGSSSRMQGIDKLYFEVAGRPLLGHGLVAFTQVDAVRSLVLVTSPDNLERARALLEDLAAPFPCAAAIGGARRQDSVASGLAALGPCDVVAIHDGARPLVTAEIIERGIAAAWEHRAAVAAVPAVDTIKEVDAGGTVTRTIPREHLWSVQTPQVFRRELLERAHREVTDDVTDDAAMVERLGERVHVFMGAYENLKVTTPPDLAVFESLLSLRSSRDVLG